jgi:hypothetical protein
MFSLGQMIGLENNGINNATERWAIVRRLRQSYKQRREADLIFMILSVCAKCMCYNVMYNTTI